MLKSTLFHFRVCYNSVVKLRPSSD
uniref:Uncharacterized protein n=1 Tax=Anguilla anguilla TaxID=7936 RepID=A0A0E9UFZ6_ANGAN